MSTDRETTRVVRSWLDKGVTALPDRVLDNVLDQLSATPQRRSSWPVRRAQALDNVARRLSTIAAVAVFAIVAIALLSPRGGSVGPPAMSPSPFSPLPTDLRLLPASGPISPGRYDIPVRVEPDATGPGRVISIAIPPDWQVVGQGTMFAPVGVTTISRFSPNTGPSLFVSFGHVATEVVVDACVSPERATYRPVGPTVDDLMTALVEQEGTHKVGPVDIVIGGRQGKRLEVSMTSSDPCPGPEGRDIWANSQDWTVPSPNNLVTDGFGILKEGTGTVVAIDVDGRRLVIGIVERGAASITVRDVDGMLASMTIE